MSWHGFKKAINRAGAQVMLKAGQIDESTDVEFEYEEKRYRAMEAATLRLHKELRHYKDSLRTLTNAQAAMTEVFAGFYGADENNVAHVYHRAMKEMSGPTLEALDEPFLQTVLNPVQRFNGYYVDVNEAIKKRANKKLDFDQLQSKLRRLVDHPKDEPAFELKMLDTQHQLLEAQEKFEAINAQLKEELPKLVELRIPYLNPLFESFVKIQLRFFSDNYNSLNEVQGKLDAQTRQDFVNGNLEKKMDGILDKIKELNIVV